MCVSESFTLLQAPSSGAGTMQLVARLGYLVDLEIICHVDDMSHSAYIFTTLQQ